MKAHPKPLKDNSSPTPYHRGQAEAKDKANAQARSFGSKKVVGLPDTPKYFECIKQLWEEINTASSAAEKVVASQVLREHLPTWTVLNKLYRQAKTLGALHKMEGRPKLAAYAEEAARVAYRTTEMLRQSCSAIVMDAKYGGLEV